MAAAPLAMHTGAWSPERLHAGWTQRVGCRHSADSFSRLDFLVKIAPSAYADCASSSFFNSRIQCFAQKGCRRDRARMRQGAAAVLRMRSYPRDFLPVHQKCEIWTAMNAAENADCLRGQCWYGERLKKSNGPVHWTGQFGQPISTQTERQIKRQTDKPWGRE